MKVSKRDILLLIGFIGILAAVCSYFFVYDPLMEKSKTLAAENVNLQAQVQQLTIWNENQPIYQSETKRMEEEISNIYQVFPVDVKEEDCIMAAITQEINSPMLVASMSIEPKVDIDFSQKAAENAQQNPPMDASTSNTTTTDGTTDPNAAAAPAIGILQNRQTTINYGVSYEGLKRSVQNIVEQTNRMAIESITVSYDDTTGLLIGSTTLNMYCIPGQDKPYVQPNFSAVLLGTDNIFGTIRVETENGVREVGVGEN